MEENEVLMCMNPDISGFHYLGNELFSILWQNGRLHVGEKHHNFNDLHMMYVT